MLLVATILLAIPVTDNVTMVVPVAVTWLLDGEVMIPVNVDVDLTAVETVRYGVIIDMPEASFAEAVA